MTLWPRLAEKDGVVARAAPGVENAPATRSERRATWVYYWVLPAALDRLGSLLSTDGLATAGVR